MPLTNDKKQHHKKRSLLTKLILFLIIFLILFTGMAHTFSHPLEHGDYRRVTSFYREPKRTLQVVNIGSSSCYAFWNPLVAWENYNVTSVPFSTGNQPFYATEYIMRDVRKTQPEAVFVVNINGVESDDMKAGYIHNLTHYMPASRNKSELVNYLCDLLDYSTLNRLEFMFPWIRLREYWLDAITTGLIPEQDGMKGANHTKNHLQRCMDVSPYYFISDVRNEIPESLTDCVRKLMDYCDETNAQVLFVVSPRAEDNEEALGRINTVADMIQDRGYEVLHLTSRADELGLDLTQDYTDEKHTNIHGSIKYTNYICEYLMENYRLMDLPEKLNRNNWDAAAGIYFAGVSPAILDIEMDTSHRRMDIEKPQNLRIEKDDQNRILLDWDEVNGASAYLVYRKDGYTASWNQIDQVEGNRFVDTDCETGIQYHYTVVPARIENGNIIYGNFSYTGVNIAL